MNQQKISIPVIDLFAGPGGLSEGFSRYSRFTRDEVDFRVKLSIEKDEVACRTLRLRSFVRQFQNRTLPKAYYSYIRCTDAEEKDKILKVLEKLPEWKLAEQEVWEAELGKVDFDTLHERVRDAVNGAEQWVLLGGPPCQVYSRVGRSRLLGPGRELRELKNKQERERRSSLGPG